MPVENICLGCDWLVAWRPGCWGRLPGSLPVSTCRVTVWLHRGRISAGAAGSQGVSVCSATGWLHRGQIAGAGMGFPAGICLRCDWLVAWWAVGGVCRCDSVGICPGCDWLVAWRPGCWGGCRVLHRYRPAVRPNSHTASGILPMALPHRGSHHFPITPTLTRRSSATTGRSSSPPTTCRFHR